MSNNTAGQSIQSLIECAMIFRRPGGGEHLYFVKAILGPSPHVACCNVCPVDARSGEFGEPEVVTAEAGTLTDLFRRVEAVLSDRHSGCQKSITFDFDKGW